MWHKALVVILLFEYAKCYNTIKYQKYMPVYHRVINEHYDDSTVVRKPNVVNRKEPTKPLIPTVLTKPKLQIKPTSINQPTSIHQPTSIYQSTSMNQPTSIDQPTSMNEATSINQPIAINQPTSTLAPIVSNNIEEGTNDIYNIKLYFIVDESQLKRLQNNSESSVRLMWQSTTEATQTTTQAPLFTDTRVHNCAQATARSRESGIYAIYNDVLGPNPFLVLCDERTALPFGWMVVQRRIDNSIDFNRNWKEYKMGFGNMRQSFWMGLEKLYAITLMEPQELLIVVVDYANVSSIALYDSFAVSSEEESFSLYVLGMYRGTAGDSLRPAQGMKFSTPDRDNDESPFKNCAAETQSGWWFRDCKTGNLNSPRNAIKMEVGNNKLGSMMWPTFRNNQPLAKVEVLIRTKKPFLRSEF